MYGALIGLSAFLVLFINLDFKPPAKNLYKDVTTLLRNAELMMLFFMNLMSGI